MLLTKEINVREELIPPDFMTGLGAVSTMIANFVGDSDALFFYANRKTRPIVAKGVLFMYKTLKDRDVKNLLQSYDSKEIINFAYHALARLDQFFSKIVKASNNYDTNAALAAGKPQDIKLVAFQKAIAWLLDDCGAIIEASNGGAKINSAISI